MIKLNTKKMDTQIAEIKKWATEGIPAIIADQNVDLKTYFQKGRLVLNLMLIEALTGAEISRVEGGKANGDYKIKFNRRLPKPNELAQIAGIVDKFIAEIENPFIARFTVADPENMDIPVGEGGSSIRLEKINKKAMKELIFGGGADAMTNRMINAIDCVTLAGIGADLKKKIIRNRVLIVGGIAMVITAGGVIGYNVYKKKNSDGCDNAPVDEPAVEIGGDDMPEVNVDDTTGDAPVVTID